MSSPVSRFVYACLGLATLLVPVSAFAQLTAIQQGVNSTAQQAGFATDSCNGVGCLYGIIGVAINVALGFSGVLLLGILVYAGFKWMTSDGEKGASEARGMIKNAIGGLILLASAYAISTFVMSQLGTLVSGGGAGAGTTSSGAAGSCTPGTSGCTAATPPTGSGTCYCVTGSVTPATPPATAGTCASGSPTTDPGHGSDCVRPAASSDLSGGATSLPSSCSTSADCMRPSSICTSLYCSGGSS